MAAKPVPLIFAGVAGALMALQGAFNSLLSKYIGLAPTTLIVHVLGTVAACALLLIPGLTVAKPLSHLGQAPWYTFLAGPIGVAIIVGVAIAIRRVGAGLATTAIIIAQLLTAYLIDHFGLFGVERLPFSLWKLLGISLLAGGGWLLLR